MSAASKPAKTADTVLQREWSAFRELLKRIGNGVLNRVFALNTKGSNQRRNMITLLFLLIGLLATLPSHGAEWRDNLRNLFATLLTNQAALAQAVTQFGLFLFRAFTDPATLRLLPVFYLPFTLSLYFASKYLADIFEIEDVNIARKFVSEVALMGGDNELRLSAAKVDDKIVDKSPITQIGGPGYVTVELDTALLVEKPDGRCRVIGPTYSGKAVLNGFERIREMIDLRDQVPDSFEIFGRSRDGIPIGISDVRVVFSIFRDTKTPTVKEPHPFTTDSIKAIVYGKANRVTDGPPIHRQWYRSSGEPLWVTPMKSLIGRELSLFIARRDLGEYLASIGTPEKEAAQKLENEIARKTRELSGPGGSIKKAAVPPEPSFSPRSQLSGQFNALNEFARNFNREQQKRGVQAQWVGVGTWKMPPGIPGQVIPEKHLEAWRITLENLSLGSAMAIGTLQQEAELDELLNLVHEIIAVYRQLAGRSLNARTVLFRLLVAYRGQLSVIRSKIPRRSKKADLQDEITRTVKDIDESIHWIKPEKPVKLKALLKPKVEEPQGASVPFMITREMRQRLYNLGYNKADVDELTPDQAWDILNASTRKPSEAGEENLYQDLLTKAHGEEGVVERLVEYERKILPNGNRREWIQNAIDRWDVENRSWR